MQNKKIAGYIRAKKMIDAGATQTDACAESGISRMTFIKYRKMFGDEISENLVEVLPREDRRKNVPVSEDPIERLVRENTVLAENLRLKKELGLIH